MKRILRFLLRKPVLWLADKFSSAPKQEKVIAALTELYKEITNGSKKGECLALDADKVRIIILSDQHKGARNGSDDFANAEKNYLEALRYYNKQEFFYISLGDCEELWENTIFSVMKHNRKVFEKEKLFIQRKSFYKIFGNHDLLWNNDPLALVYLKKMYREVIKIYTGIVLRIQLRETIMNIFCTHGHQGDAQSDGNAFSKFFVSDIWGPLQNFLAINPNTPSTNDNIKTQHNLFMYEWSAAQKNTLLITGHTHQPVFNSLTHLERLYQQLEEAELKNDTEAIAKIESEIPRRKREYDFVNANFRSMKPSYFNTGCCCFEDGTITGIELADGCIRLIKWSYVNGKPTRTVAEETTFEELAVKLNAG